MSEVRKARMLTRLRNVERRLAAASVAVAASRLVEAQTRIARLEQLSRAIAGGPGPASGAAFASGGECVARLLQGSISMAAQRDGQHRAIDNARASFSVADARAQIAGRNLAMAERTSQNNAEKRAALKMPAPGVTPCR